MAGFLIASADNDDNYLLPDYLLVDNNAPTSKNKSNQLDQRPKVVLKIG